VSHWLIAIIQ